MHWQNIPPTTLLQDYGTWITPRLVLNNRVIGLLGLAEIPYQPMADASAWVLRHPDGRILQIMVHAPREIALVNHPDLPLDASQVVAIHRHFPGSWVLTCHDGQCESWEKAAQTLSIKDVPLLCTWLYQVAPHQLRQKPLPPDLRFERLPHFSRPICRFIQGFMHDALHQKIDEDEARSRFTRQEFFGLFQGDTLLSIAAVTRRLAHARCLSYVYTPSRLRGHDYAGLTVEYLCRHLFQDPTMQLVFLYADQTNPHSNRLYQKLGFEMICISKTF
ncbi:MAG TPA: GNAT family N-acetyltransferase [Oligoflexus sp.]|uniref:GNAT family N-acetyltransferase n=1 Tax=Oligoflexus sp. TaxID=1971216 RepID=UPI002D508AED|nr:GNAT family N-acetyltransferase [Oligoflexus sp.]HYX35454.1 GNAT family N-acetyltransferase [Oligoflexus sp.]